MVTRRLVRLQPIRSNVGLRRNSAHHYASVVSNCYSVQRSAVFSSTVSFPTSAHVIMLGSFVQKVRPTAIHRCNYTATMLVASVPLNPNDVTSRCCSVSMLVHMSVVSHCTAPIIQSTCTWCCYDSVNGLVTGNAQLWPCRPCDGFLVHSVDEEAFVA